MPVFLEYFHGWVWVGLTVENAFMGGCTFLEYVWLWVSVGVCDCLKHIYEWVYLSKRHLWMSVTVQKTFMGGCDCLKHLYGWVLMGVTGCGWVGKMVKPLQINLWWHLTTYFSIRHFINLFTKIHGRISYPLRKKSQYLELFWRECEKMRTRITNTDTFQAVINRKVIM